MEWLFKKIAELELISAASIMGLRVSMLAGKFLLALFIVKFISLEALGIYGLVAGTSAIIQMVVRLGIFSNLSRIAVNQPLSELTQNLRNYGVGTGIFYLVLFIPTLALGYYFNQPHLAVLSFFIVVTEHIGNDIFVLCNNLHRPKLANVLLTVQSASWIYLYIVLAYFIPALQTLEWIFAFWIAGGTITAAITAILVRAWPWGQAFASKLSLGWYIDHIRQAWRIFFSDVLNAVTIYADRYLITFFLSLEMVGIYVLFWQVTNAICNLIGAGVLQVYRPRLITAYQNKIHSEFNRLFKESAVRSIALTIMLSIASALVVPYLIKFTGQPTALEYIPFFWLMLMATLFRVGADIGGYTLFALHRDDLVLTSGIFKLTLAIIGGIMFLMIFGLYGIIPATILTGLGTIFYIVLKFKR